MEKGKQRGSSSSSFTEDLFGPKDCSKSPSSSVGLFGSIFGPPNLVPGRDTPRSDFGSAYGNTKHKPMDQVTQKSNRVMKKDKNPSYEKGTTEPCYYNSSIYYGGQEVYSPTTHNTSPHYVVSSRNPSGTYQFRKYGEGVDRNENNSNSVSRGNWWQGSLYY